MYELQRDKMTRLTFGGNGQHAPVWSPSGNYVIYEIVGQGIFRMKADGSGKPELLVEGKPGYPDSVFHQPGWEALVLYGNWKPG